MGSIFGIGVGRTGSGTMAAYVSESPVSDVSVESRPRSSVMVSSASANNLSSSIKLTTFELDPARGKSIPRILVP